MSALKEFLRCVAEAVPLSVYRLVLRRDVLGLYYHAVSDQPLPHIRHLYSYKSARMFESDLAYLAGNFNLISYGQLATHQSGGQRLKPRSLILTLDDGLAEGYSVVRPLLLKHGIPCVFFVTTNYIDNHEMMADHMASLCIDRVASLACDALNDTVKSVRDAFGAELSNGTELIAWVKSTAAIEPATADSLCRLLGVDVRQYLETERPYLSSAEIESLARDGFTIGAHSTRHQLYGPLAESVVEDDIVASCDTIASLSGQSEVPFAFPTCADSVSRDLLLELRNKHKQVGLFFGTSGICADRDFVINRMCGDWRTNADGEKSNLSVRLVKGYVEELARRVRRQ
jgi:peptidoglycan/xylan/chitin deacetylase (PgdA/CDA1 family)